MSDNLTFGAASYVWPAELYQAARETCRRLYIANGGSRYDSWKVQPYPGTAAISYSLQVWTLCMPAFPMDKKLPRWRADLILAYTVHELLHALKTEFPVMHQAKSEGLGSLLNALEDVRIEAWGGTNLGHVANARGLLQALTAHIVQRDTAKGYRVESPAAFAFTLNCILFREVVGYDLPAFPTDWRKRVPAAWLPLIDMAIRDIGQCQDTSDVLALARRLQQAAQTQQPQPPQPPQTPQTPQPGDGGDDTGGDDGTPQRAPEGADADPCDTGDSAGDDNASDDNASDDDAGQGGAGQGGDDASDDVGDDTGDNSDDGAGRGSAPDLSDTTQEYSEAALDDLSNQPPPKPTRGYQQAANLKGIEEFINAPEAQLLHWPATRRAPHAAVGHIIATPNRLKRHLTLAVHSPERVGYERRQSAGRFDMRELAASRAGSLDVFRRRVETEGQESVVTLLLDHSSSMEHGGAITRQQAAAAMALHMGDALHAAGVKFEIAAFQTDDGLETRYVILKPHCGRWNDEAKERVGSFAVTSGDGTSMMPAMRLASLRLARVPNVTRRILVTLTDGQDTWRPESIAACCRHWAKRGVETVGIGLAISESDQDRMRQQFLGRCVFVDDVRRLAEMGMRELLTVLQAGAPRAA